SLFINDDEVAVKNVYRTNPNTFPNIHQTEATFKIGAEENYCGYIHKYEKYFKGKLDDIRIYNRILSSQELSRLYDSPPNKSLFICVIIILVLITILFTRLSNGNEVSSEIHIQYPDLKTKIIFSLILV